jgi:hypothetical protein
VTPGDVSLHPDNTASASRASGLPRPTPRLNRSMILTRPRGPQRLTQPNPIRPAKICPEVQTPQNGPFAFEGLAKPLYLRDDPINLPRQVRAAHPLSR